MPADLAPPAGTSSEAQKNAALEAVAARHGLTAEQVQALAAVGVSASEHRRHIERPRGNDDDAMRWSGASPGCAGGRQPPSEPSCTGRRRASGLRLLGTRLPTSNGAPEQAESAAHSRLPPWVPFTVVRQEGQPRAPKRVDRGRRGRSESRALPGAEQPVYNTECRRPPERIPLRHESREPPVVRVTDGCRRGSVGGWIGIPQDAWKLGGRRRMYRGGATRSCCGGGTPRGPLPAPRGTRVFGRTHRPSHEVGS